MAKLKVLIAEDDKVTRRLFGNGLPDDHFDLHFVDNGEEALTAYKRWQPQIILLDLMMPNMNGYEVLSTIRQTLNDRTTPVVIVSSLASRKDVLAVARLGIQGYIVKPFKMRELAAAVLRCYQATSAAG